MHENLNRPEKIKYSTEKSFGFVFSAVFFLISVAPLLYSRPFRFWFLIASSIFLAITLLDPARLRLLNRLWGKLGLLLNKIVSPVFLGILFFVAFLPVGLILRLFKKDILSLKFNKGLKSYWITPSTEPSTMKDQF